MKTILKQINTTKNQNCRRYYLGILYLKQQKRDKERDMIDELIEMSSKYADKLKEKTLTSYLYAFILIKI